VLPNNVITYSIHLGSGKLLIALHELFNDVWHKGLLVLGSQRTWLTYSCHGKLFIGGPCKKRANDYLSRHQLKMVIAIYTGHASVRGHLYIMGLFDGDPICSFCGMEAETVQHIICCCEALARQSCNVFGSLTVEPKDISTASVRDLCLFIRGAGLLSMCWIKY